MDKAELCAAVISLYYLLQISINNNDVMRGNTSHCTHHRSPFTNSYTSTSARLVFPTSLGGMSKLRHRAWLFLAASITLHILVHRSQSWQSHDGLQRRSLDVKVSEL
jgi:hypothetical protein